MRFLSMRFSRVPATTSAMTLSAWIILSTAIVAGSFLSGVFGMAGGMVVIGVLLIYFDVPTAMILFSIIQLAANGWRAMQWWSYVRWRIVWLYCLGGLVAFAGMRLVEFVPDKALVYLLLGLTPFAVDVLPKSWRPDIEWRGVLVHHRHLHHHHPVHLRRRRAVPRHLLPEEHARPQDHARHQGGRADRRATSCGSSISSRWPASAPASSPCRSLARLCWRSAAPCSRPTSSSA